MMKIEHKNKKINPRYTEAHEKLRRCSDDIFKRYYKEFFFSHVDSKDTTAWINDGNITRLSENEIVMYGRVDIWKHSTGVDVKSWTYRPDEIYCVNYKQHVPEYNYLNKVIHNLDILWLQDLNMSQTSLRYDIPSINNLNLYYLIEFETGRVDESKIKRMESIINKSKDLFKVIFVYENEIPETCYNKCWIDFISINECYDIENDFCNNL